MREAHHDVERRGPAVYADLAGKVAVVTGGSRGIGAATAKALAANTVAVAVVGRDQTAIDATVAAIVGDGGRAIGVAADCTIDSDLDAAHRRVIDQLGAVDIVAAFAGGNGAPVATAEETAAHWRTVIDGELTSVFLTISKFLPEMIARGTGSIITMSSAAARQPAGSSAAYAAAKGGIVAFSRHLANEVAHAGVRVNCLAPSAVANDKMRAHMPPDRLGALGATFPLGRLGEPEDIAAAALFLASAQAGWITGVTLDVAGGKIML